MPARRSVLWRHDPVILARLRDVERLHFEGKTNVAIARALGVDERSIRRDLERLTELWRERIGAQADDLRARVVSELADIKAKALEAAAFDRAAEQAVLFGVPFVDAEGNGHRVYRDEKDAASFRGQKAQSLNVARQAVMDQAKVLGIIVEKQQLTADPDAPLVIRVEYDEPKPYPSDSGPPAAPAPGAAADYP